MKLFIIFIIASFSYIYAGVIGTVDAVQGNVKVKSQDNIKKIKVEAGYQIQEGDLIATYRNSFAKIVLIDNSTVVLDADSMIHFDSSVDLKQEQGRVFYKITSKKAKNSMKVATNFAIIGIKGTTFIVKADQQKEVLLQEGTVGINSIKQQFELYRKKVYDEFEAYKRQQEQGFEEYKAAFEEYEPMVETKEFDLEKQNKVSFDDNVVKENGFNEKDEDEFKYFEQFLDAN